MKMGHVEKLFVNSDRHSSRVAAQAEERIRPARPKPGQRLLDVGCGNGKAAISLTHAFSLEVTGVDVDPDQIKAANQVAADLPDAHFLVADATQLPLPDDEFDIVYTNKTTHHIPNWPQAIAEMARVLKPGGYLVYSDFATPLGDRLPTRQGIEEATAAAGLELTRHTHSPFHYAGYFKKEPSPAAPDPRYTQTPNSRR
jgi:ubiquinone/menaquinone biosynthesis C-methylase UbiE